MLIAKTKLNVLKEQKKTITEQTKIISVTNSFVEQSDQEDELYRHLLSTVEKKRALENNNDNTNYQIKASFLDSNALPDGKNIENETELTIDDGLKVNKTPPLKSNTKDLEKSFPEIDDLLNSESVIKELSLPLLNFNVSR